LRRKLLQNPVERQGYLNRHINNPAEKYQQKNLNTNFSTLSVKKVDLSQKIIWTASLVGIFLLFNLDESTFLTDKVEIRI
jgi:hypothetical protein